MASEPDPEAVSKQGVGGEGGEQKVYRPWINVSWMGTRRISCVLGQVHQGPRCHSVLNFNPVMSSTVAENHRWLLAT